MEQKDIEDMEFLLGNIRNYAYMVYQEIVNLWPGTEPANIINQIVGDWDDGEILTAVEVRFKLRTLLYKAMMEEFGIPRNAASIPNAVNATEFMWKMLRLWPDVEVSTLSLEASKVLKAYAEIEMLTNGEGTDLPLENPDFVAAVKEQLTSAFGPQRVEGNERDYN